MKQKKLRVAAPSCPAPAAKGQYVDKAGLARHFGFKSTRTVDALIRKRKLPVIVIGYRSRIFFIPDCEAALKKFTVREVGG